MLKVTVMASSSFYRFPMASTDGVSKRLERNQLRYPWDHDFRIILAELTLHTDVAAGDVVVGRLDRLLAAMRVPRLSFGIVPMNAYCPAPSMNFVKYGDRMVLVEGSTAEPVITQPREIAIYARAFETFAGLAVIGAAARV
ncbi:Scr1 family TA system antitoxin-like transcriptional regulator [Nocardia sp. NPDC049707]|uniref:Scr1 family TA system antitoxin-like transcriptional regulator n=1 Tax=Nocardia sp. NPDC049707 TaxID=3154735 RepID=UPI00342D1567